VKAALEHAQGGAPVAAAAGRGRKGA